MSRPGVIAGEGRLPLIWVERAIKSGYEPLVFIIEEELSSFDNIQVEKINVNLAKLDNLIKTIKNSGVDKIILLGKVHKDRLHSLKFDNRMSSLLARLENLETEEIMKALIEELNFEGIEVMEQKTFIEDMLASPGILGSRKPSYELLEEMEYSFRIAKEIAGLDIGQTIISKEKNIVAVEALEGTDATIKRAGSLAGEKTVMAKVAKKGKDLHFDLPTVGLRTLNNLIDIKAAALVIEVGKTFIIDKDEFIKKADNANIIVMAME